MIIDLSIPRTSLKDVINKAIFDAKMKGFKLSKYQITSILTAAIIFGYDNGAYALQRGVQGNKGLRNDIYAIIITFGEIPRMYTIEDIKNIYHYYRK